MIGDVKILQQKVVPADGHCCIERVVELNNRENLDEKKKGQVTGESKLLVLSTTKTKTILHHH
jgi:hypothetical protein